MIEGLSDRAAVWRPDHQRWTQAEELAAQQIEVIDAWGRMIYGTLYAAHSGGKKPKMPPAYSVEHPGRTRSPAQRPEPTNDPVQIRQFFTRHFGRR